MFIALTNKVNFDSACLTCHKCYNVMADGCMLDSPFSVSQVIFGYHRGLVSLVRKAVIEACDPVVYLVKCNMFLLNQCVQDEFYLRPFWSGATLSVT